MECAWRVEMPQEPNQEPGAQGLRQSYRGQEMVWWEEG